MSHQTSSNSARVSLSELTENRGLFITKVFISIQFTNRLVCSGAAFAHRREMGQTL